MTGMTKFSEESELIDHSQPVLLEIDGPVAKVRFNRPDAMNAINVAMAQAFLSACLSIAEQPEIRVVVVSGEGPCFMAGGDIACFHQDLKRAPDTARAIIDPLNEALSILAGLAQPVIASVHGAVAGAGVSLMLACDLAIAAENARFNLAYARIGASLDGSGSWSLPRVVGLRKAMELALLSETLDSTAAHSLGLVNRVVPAQTLHAETDALAQRLAAGPTMAYGRIKHLLRTASSNGLEEQMAAERAAFCAGASDRDFREGIGAFFQKRSPIFVGH